MPGAESAVTPENRHARPPLDAVSEPKRGFFHAHAALLSALGGFALLSLGDGLTKSTAGAWPGPAVAALRYGLAAFVLALVAARRHGFAAFAMPRPWLQLGRGAAVAISTLCFFISVQLMPLATVTAVGFTTPMMTALFSALLLGERASLRIWLVSVAAFAGVLLVLRPDIASLGGRAFLPLASAASMALLIIGNRAAAGAASPLAMQAMIALVAAPLLIAAAAGLHLTGLPEFQIGMPTARVIGAAAAVAVTATGAHWLIYLATTGASAAAIAPAIYVQIVFAVVIGWLFFGDVPDLLSLLGCAVIVLAGLWLFRANAVRPPAR